MSNRFELESDLMDAAHMARMTVEFVGRALGVDKAGPTKLTDQEGTLLSFAVMQTCVFIEAARDTFYKQIEEAADA